jgi:nucleoside-diphosphate-sugar epimerase
MRAEGDPALNVLVVGGTRFLGHELVLRLLAAGHRVTLFNRGTMPDAFGERVERLRGDRTTDAFARLLAGRSFDVAVDFAAYTGADGRQVVGVLAGRVGHCVVVSTGQVYLVLQTCPRPARESDYDGEVMPEPSDPFDRGQWGYGVGKRALEDALAEAWDRERFPATRLRLPMVNGERDHSRRLERYLWRMLDRGPVLLPDGGDRMTRHVYSGSVVRAICAILGRADTFGRAFNLAQDETPTLRELLTLAAHSLGAPVQLVDVPSNEVLGAGLDPLALSPFSGHWMSFLDPSRAKAQLGFRHEPLACYLDKIVTTFLAHPPAEPPPGYAARATELALLANRGSR